MTTLANQLVQFLMSLFNNPAAVQEFLNDPERALDGAGLHHVGSADVDAVMPVVLDYAPITVHAPSFSRDNTGGNSSWIGAATGNTPAPVGNTQLDDHAHAVQQLTHVVNNYSYTSVVDDRDTTTDHSVNENIWAQGDVHQWFQNEAVIASGDHALASGADLNVHDSHTMTDSFNTDNSLDAATDSWAGAGPVGAAAVSPGPVITGGDVAIGTPQWDVADSFNTDVDLDAADSFNSNQDSAGGTPDHSTSTDVPVAAEDSSADDHSAEGDHSANDHLATNEAGIADSFHDDAVAAAGDVSIADSFTPLEAEDSYPDSHDTLDDHDSLDHSVDADPDVHTVPPVDDSHIVL